MSVGESVGGERGSGGMLALAVLAMIAVLVVAVVGLGAALAARQRVIAAADAGALAAADTALGIHPGVPCVRAAEVVATYGAELAACETEGVVVTVTVVTRIAGVLVTVRSRAGPAP